ncbi:MAG: hypothetical protein ABIO24_02425, partial [Saprospiraceae bacterium]
MHHFAAHHSLDTALLIPPIVVPIFCPRCRVCVRYPATFIPAINYFFAMLRVALLDMYNGETNRGIPMLHHILGQ